MKNKIIKSVSVFIALAVLIIIYIVSTNVKTEDIKTVYYSSAGGYHEADIYYTIDFEKNTIVREVKNGSLSAERWAKSRSKEIYTTGVFTDAMKERLVKSANRYGVPRWSGVYKTNHKVNDVTVEEITVELKNGRNKMILCAGRYPLTFFKMRKEFYDILGDF